MRAGLADEDVMQVADDNIVHLTRTIDLGGGFGISGAGTPLECVDETLPHDPRGLVVSLALCLGCWGVLAYFLLT